jgi:hypothetical protein
LPQSSPGNAIPARGGYPVSTARTRISTTIAARSQCRANIHDESGKRQTHEGRSEISPAADRSAILNVNCLMLIAVFVSDAAGI